MTFAQCSRCNSLGLGIGFQLQYWLSHYINDKWSIDIDVLKTIILCRHRHLFAHCITVIAYSRKNLLVMRHLKKKCPNDTKQFSLKTCENDINIELTHNDKIFCSANRQIYRYTIYCAIPTIVTILMDIRQIS